MVGRASLSPGRVLALAGALTAVGGLYQRVPGGGALWQAVGAAGRAAVIAGMALLLGAVFRPEQGRLIELSGAGLEHLVGWGAVLLAALHPDSPMLAAGALGLTVGASWDLVAAWRATSTGTAVPGADGRRREGAPVAAGVSERAR